MKKSAGNPTGKNQHTKQKAEPPTDLFEMVESDGGIVDNIHNSYGEVRPTGTSRLRSLRKLRTTKGCEALYQRVLAGELSPNAGMIEAGFRRVPTALEIARRAWRKMTDFHSCAQ